MKDKKSDIKWYETANISEVPSPALLVFPDRVESNIRKMIEIAGDVNKLRPHVKTHKMPEIIRLQIKHGISKFKCSTISEAEMCAKNGASDILLALQPVGPNIDRFFTLKHNFPELKFSCITDNELIIRQIADRAVKYGSETHLWIDINNGMNRTGIAPDENAARLFELINMLPMLKAEGLHVYDGHIRDKDFSVRKKKSDEGFEAVYKLAEKIRTTTNHSIQIVAGGSPTFRVHAMRDDVDCSPGTVLLWDYGYSSSLPDMDFLHAAVIMTRIVSKPAEGLVALDLGHKAIASEMPHPRIAFMGIDDYTVSNHSEEHLVIKFKGSEKMNVGDVIYGVPWHICPTVDRHDFVTIVTNNNATGKWVVEARKRMITI